MLDTSKLAALGWASTPIDEAMAATVAEHVESDRDGAEHDPGRDREAELIEALR